MKERGVSFENMDSFSFSQIIL